MFSKMIHFPKLAAVCTILVVVALATYAVRRPTSQKSSRASAIPTPTPSVTGKTVDHVHGTPSNGEHDHCFRQMEKGEPDRDVILTVSPDLKTNGFVTTVLVDLDPKIRENQDATVVLEYPVENQPQQIKAGSTIDVTFSDALVPHQKNAGGNRTPFIHLGTGPYVAAITVTPISADRKLVGKSISLNYYYETFSAVKPQNENDCSDRKPHM
jgi:hypothetical protein